MIDFFRQIWLSIFCTHKFTDEVLYYCVNSISTPTIFVYHDVTCKKCGRQFTSMISEYPFSYYNLKKLEDKGVQSAEDIIQKRIKLKEGLKRI